MGKHLQDIIHEKSMKDPEGFWMKRAENLRWQKKPSRALNRSQKTLQDGTTHPHWSWFPDGEISTCYNCVDRHVLSGAGDRTAIIWESPVTGESEQYTYSELLKEVETLAGVLREEGVKKGHVVLIYMPMIPAALFAMLAIGRIGAIHAVVFGGFSPPSLAQRIEASRPDIIMTASCGIEAGKSPIVYRDLIRSAIKKSSFKPIKTIIWQRDQLRWHPVVKTDGERNWQRLVKSAKNRGLKAEAVSIGSNDGLYIIYTSGEFSGMFTNRYCNPISYGSLGTTGLPKGVIREAGGHAVGLNLSIRYLFGINPGDVIFTASDIGWVSRFLWSLITKRKWTNPTTQGRRPFVHSLRAIAGWRNYRSI
jgi:propionyl-CoA synthetase